MTSDQNPYSPPNRLRETERVDSQRRWKIARADLFTKLCFTFGSFGLSVGISLTAMYGFAWQSADHTRRASQLGTLALGVSIGLLLLAVSQMRAKSHQLSDDPGT